MKKALITGISGMCASYMAELLLRKGYEVHGLARRTAAGNKAFWRLDKVLGKPNFKIVPGDITDPITMETIIKEGQYDEVYNYAAQSHVQVSFREPKTTIDVNFTGVFNLLEAIRKYSPKTKFFQASTSEMFGSSKGNLCGDGVYRQNENTPFSPRSVYGIAKVSSFYLVKLYREAFGIFAVNSIGFNKEGPRRSVDFVTRKITSYIGQLVNKKTTEKLKLGNIYAERDWCHATDAVYAHYLIMQHKEPMDFVIGTGVCNSVKRFLELAFGYVNLNWEDHVEFDKSLERPAEVDYLRADITKIKNVIGWEPHVTLDKLIAEMVDNDIAINR